MPVVIVVEHDCEGALRVFRNPNTAYQVLSKYSMTFCISFTCCLRLPLKQEVEFWEILFYPDSAFTFGLCAEIVTAKKTVCTVYFYRRHLLLLENALSTYPMAPLGLPELI
jgi:hypothetical protein